MRKSYNGEDALNRLYDVDPDNITVVKFMLSLSRYL